MAQREGFKHITVTAAEDEDVVILAGASAETAEGAQEGLAPEGRAQGGSAEVGFAREESGDTGCSGGESAEERSVLPSDEDGTCQPESTSAELHRPSGATPSTTHQSKSDKSAYRETTLDDLEREPMPFAQRVVIVAAIVCIIGAIIYCVAFMR